MIAGQAQLGNARHGGSRLSLEEFFSASMQ